VSEVIGIGPRAQTDSQGVNLSSGGISGGSAQIKLDATPERKYRLTFTQGFVNLFNVVNLAPPNGTLLSPLFGRSQSLATGAFANDVPGNRYIYLTATFNF
jgi:hypothetical protein